MELENSQRIQVLRMEGYEFNREELEKIKRHEKPHPIVEMTKKYRNLEQESLICSYQNPDIN